MLGFALNYSYTFKNIDFNQNYPLITNQTIMDIFIEMQQLELSLELMKYFWYYFGSKYKIIFSCLDPNGKLVPNTLFKTKYIVNGQFFIKAQGNIDERVKYFNFKLKDEDYLSKEHKVISEANIEVELFLIVDDVNYREIPS